MSEIILHPWGEQLTHSSVNGDRQTPLEGISVYSEKEVKDHICFQWVYKESLG